MQISVNYTAIVAAAVINMVLGFIWYGPLFGKQWIKMNGITKEDMERSKKEGMTKSYAIAIVGALVMAYVFSHFLVVGNAATISDGATVGFWLWLGFIATTTVGGMLWGKKPFNLFLLENGYYLVLLVINGALLAVWK